MGVETWEILFADNKIIAMHCFVLYILDGYYFLCALEYLRIHFSR